MNDARRAARSLRRSWRTAAAAVLCVAVGSAAVAAMLTLVRAALLRPLPFPHAERLVRVWVWDDAEARRLELSWPLVAALAESPAFERLEATVRARVVVFGDEGGRRVEGEGVTPGYFALLGIEPALGRPFTAEEHAPGGYGPVLLSHAAWGAMFGFDDEVVGRTLRTDAGPLEVVGVLPEGFTGTVEDDAGEIELWLPAEHVMSERRRAAWGENGIWALGRVAPGGSPRAAQEALAGLALRLAREQPDAHRDRALLVEPMAENWRAALRPGARVLLGAALALLLVAALDVSTLLLALSMLRTRARAVERALGATSAALARRSLAEAAVVVAVGGGLGVVLAALGLPRLLATTSLVLPDYVTLRPDAAVFAAVLAVLGAAGLVAALLPTLLERRGDPAAALSRTARGGSASPAGRRAWTALVVAQVALSAVLLFASTLLLRSHGKLLSEDLGFRSADRLRIGLFVGEGDAADTADVLPFLHRVRDRIAVEPGVADAGLVWPTVPIWGAVEEAVHWPGMPAALAERGLRVGLYGIDDRALPLLGVPLVAGRGLRSEDHDRPVVLVSRHLADLLGGPPAALGREVTMGGGPLRVVGVVGDTRFGGARQDPPAEVFLPLGLVGERLATLVVVAEPGAPELAPALSRRLGELAPHAALDWVGTLDYWLGERYRDERLAPVLLAVFTAAALLITAVGLFALLAASVERQRPDLGVRKALGAGEGRLVALVVRQSVAVTALGVVAGLAAAWPVARLLAGLTYGVEPLDAASLAVAAGSLLAVAGLAAWLPARRAAATDPMRVLREE